MLRVLISRQSRYPTDVKALKKRVSLFLSEKGVVDAEVSIAIVGERKMKMLAQTYLKEKPEDPVHEVLSFPYAQTDGSASGDFIQSGVLQLGDIIICYPQARHIAMKRNRMVDDIIGELVEHGVLHLLGIHHD